MQRLLRTCSTTPWIKRASRELARRDSIESAGLARLCSRGSDAGSVAVATGLIPSPRSAAGFTTGLEGWTDSSHRTRDV